MKPVGARIVVTYSSALVPLHIVIFAIAAEATGVDKVGKILLHLFFDDSDRLFETFPRVAGEVKMEWWSLQHVSQIT